MCVKWCTFTGQNVKKAAHDGVWGQGNQKKFPKQLIVALFPDKIGETIQ
jgi:hypothetical protein